MLVPIPPLEVQGGIVDAVDEGRRATEDLRTAIVKQTFRLAERKWSLIMAAVAGELDLGNLRSRSMIASHLEASFESAIEAHLLEHGWLREPMLTMTSGLVSTRRFFSSSLVTRRLKTGID